MQLVGFRECSIQVLSGDIGCSTTQKRLYHENDCIMRVCAVIEYTEQMHSLPVVVSSQS